MILTYFAIADVLREDKIVDDVHTVEHVEDYLQEGEQADQVKKGDCHRLVGQKQVVYLIELRQKSFFNSPQEVLIKHR